MKTKRTSITILYFIYKSLVFSGDEEDSAIIMMSLQDKKNLNKENKEKAYNESTHDKNKVLF